MTLAITVLPLRLTSARQDLAGMLADWMDSSRSLGLSSLDCRADLESINHLRQEIFRCLDSKDSYEGALQLVDKWHVYYHYLLECELKGMDGGSECVSLEWESALTGEMQTSSSLGGERAGLLWNLAALEAYQASQQPLNSKVGWSKAAQHLQNSASWLQHLPRVDPAFVDFSPTFVSLWQALLVAQSQRCVYESLACAPRPRHLLLAKLAAAAIPLFSEVETVVKKDDNSPAPALAQFSSLVGSWAEFARAWGIYMASRAEYHQSQLSREKKLWGQEIARLHSSYQYAALCNDCCERTALVALQDLHMSVNASLKDLKARIDTAEQENAEQHNQPVPTRQELAEIRGEKLVNINQPLAKMLNPKTTEPIFQNTASNGSLRVYVDVFVSEMDQTVAQIAKVAEDRIESARKALASVNLPHSLTAYRQVRSGGGIPDDLWQRVQAIQRERRVAQLKQDLWELRDAADLARTTHQRVASELDFDLESDRLFRQSNSGFEGHSAEEVQKSFRKSLANYDRLLVSAQEGDSVLLRRLEQLDTNPKYKLLQFQKSQLDRLLPGAGGSGGGPNSLNNSNGFDTSHLSRLLVELSALFQEREVLLNAIREEVRNFDIEGALISRVGSERAASDQEYSDALAYARKSFDGMFYEMESNIEKQTDLLDAILAENEKFMVARERTHNSHSADSCILMIEDAIEEIDQLSKHLTEGKDFYNVVIPKLDKLKQQVGDVSARLTVERLEYDDRADRARQEEKDAKMAMKLSSGAEMNSSQPHAAGDGNAPRVLPGASPGAGGDPPRTKVDDEKVATLVAMEFDPAKVVAALIKHDNNMDQALNELLSC
jgi:BRO1-like domain/ALIX V-shaped domain binding to HIV